MSENTSCFPESIMVDGYQVPEAFSPDDVRSAMRYKPRPGDLFLVTYAKCGTTWAQFVLVVLFNDGQPLPKQQMSRLGVPFIKDSASPFLEAAGAIAAEKMPRPGVIKTHLPFHLVPWSTEAKYIYMTRNPKDCCVSFFFHRKNCRGGFSGTFDEFFEYFLQGKTNFGDYFSHLLQWYAHRNDPNVLFLTYEEMKEDPQATILKMASFIDDERYAEPLRRDPQKLANIMKYSSFEYMKEILDEYPEEANITGHAGKLKQESTSRTPNISLNVADKEGPVLAHNVRKGVVKDWKNYFTEEQSRRMDERFAERMKGTDIPKLWEKYM